MAKFCLFGDFFFDCFFFVQWLSLNHFCQLQFSPSKKIFKKSSSENWMKSDLRNAYFVWSSFGRGFLFCGDHGYRLLVKLFLSCFFSLIFSFLATIVNSNLQHRTKDTEKKLNLELNWGLRIQSPRCSQLQLKQRTCSHSREYYVFWAAFAGALSGHDQLLFVKWFLPWMFSFRSVVSFSTTILNSSLHHRKTISRNSSTEIWMNSDLRNA